MRNPVTTAGFVRHGSPGSRRSDRNPGLFTVKTETKVYLDRRVGVPVAWLLNLAAHVLGKVLRRNHGITAANVRTIVFAKYVGMGSIIQATPLIRTIKNRFPQARIIFVTNHSCRQLVERLEHIDAIIPVDDRGFFRLGWSSLRVVAALMRAGVDLFFDLEMYSAYGSVMSLLSLSRNRIGFYRRSAEHKVGIYTHLLYFNARHPVRYIYLQLARAVGCEPVEPDRLGPVRVTASDRAEVAGKLCALGIEPQRYLVVSPNADLMSERRRWPTNRFASLIQQAIGRLDLPVVLTGVRAERPLVASIVEQIPGGGTGRVHNLAGELSLGGLLALLEQARCLITIDTGPMHMAWALGTPTVCLFGPGDPVHYGWAGSGVEILYERVYCSPCLYETDEPPCRGDNVCMQRITVEAVLAAIQRVLANAVPNRVTAFEDKFFLDGGGGPLGRVIRGSVEDATW
jgi:ADP-heptose:LPS heptosyltransferase